MALSAGRERVLLASQSARDEVAKVVVHALGGMGSLNVAVYTEGNTDSSKSNNNGKRMNLGW